MQDKRITIEWGDLKYTAPLQKGKEQKVILRAIGGSAKPGKVLAIMGPSGSGKTSLLNVLSLRSTVGVSGSIEMNGAPATRAARKIMGYVMQKDIFFSHLTVQETLHYTALLRLGRNMTFDEKMQRVDEVIELLGLEKCRNTRVGTTQDRGISGGELKRLNVGNELLSTPQLFFLDEPTSGLDSSNALNLVENLVEFAHKSGITVVMSIHQPASQIFHRFDDLLLMMNGNVVYDGPAGTVGDYFAAMGHHCPPGFNVADFFMDLLSDESLEEELLHAYRRAVNKRDTDLNGDSLTSGSSTDCSPPDPRQESRTPPDMARLAVAEAPKAATPVKELAADAAANAPTHWSQVMALMRRNLKKDARGIVTWVEVTQCIAVALIAGGVWWQCFRNYTEVGLRDRVGALYFLAAYWMFVPAFGALTNFPPERDVIAKERSAKTFRISSYFFAKSLSDFPVTLIMPMLFLVVFYPMAGMEWEAKVVFGTFGALLLYVEIGQSIGSLISCMVADFKTGALVTSVSLLSFMLVGGFYVDLENIPNWLSWLRYISFYHYATGAFLNISVTGKEFECVERSYSGCPITGEEVLSLYDKDLNYWQSYLVMIGFYLFFRLCLYLGLRFGKQLRVQ